MHPLLMVGVGQQFSENKEKPTEYTGSPEKTVLRQIDMLNYVNSFGMTSY